MPTNQCGHPEGVASSWYQTFLKQPFLRDHYHTITRYMFKVYNLIHFDIHTNLWNCRQNQVTITTTLQSVLVPCIIFSPALLASITRANTEAFSGTIDLFAFLELYVNEVTQHRLLLFFSWLLLLSVIILKFITVVKYISRFCFGFCLFLPSSSLFYQYASLFIHSLLVDIWVVFRSYYE